MNDQDQQLEAKLASLRPKKPSKDLVDRIAQSVSDQQRSVVVDQPSVTRSRLRMWSIVAGLAAVVLVALTLWLARPPQVPNPTNREIAVQLEPVIATPQRDDLISPAREKSLPTVANYVRAMRESPESLDVLLQKHADTLMPPTQNFSLNQLMQETSS